jgi:DNA polymerase III delta prime subunit
MLVGHGKIIEDLKRLAAEKKLAHGYIFFGPAMVGKRLVALNFANFLESGDFSEPFDYTQGKPKILSDALFIGPDERGTVGIDSIRAIKNFLWQKPNASAYRTVIIDDAELMTAEAQNALLKVAEEPPHSTLLILITSDIDGLAATVSSRLQKIYFSAASPAVIKEWAKKEFPAAKNLEDFVERSFGKPGLLAAMISDRKFQAVLKSADNLLKLRGEPPRFGERASQSRRDFIKKLLAPEDFDFPKFLDALIILILSQGFGGKEKINRWHKLLRLRHEIAYFNLNPRLQLENLFAQSYTKL